MVENKFYERKIKYLDLMENEDRIGGAGFVKAEVRGTDVSLVLTVRGLHPTDTYEREVMLQEEDGESAVGRISLKQGQGQFTYHAVMDYSRLRGIRIVLGGARQIRCRWQEEKKAYAGRGSAVSGNALPGDGASGDALPGNGASGGTLPGDGAFGDVLPGNAASGNVSSGNTPPGNAPFDDTSSAGSARRDADGQRKAKKMREIQVIPWDEIRAAEESLEKVKQMRSNPAESEVRRERENAGRTEVRARRRAEEENAGRVEKEPRKAENPIGRDAMEWDTKNAADAVSEKSTERRTDKLGQRTSSGRASGREKRPVRMMEDKWQQIWAIYPHIQPFQDEREYLSISPADFVLLSGEAYRAANNSFLLHGYYNYDHLILTKLEKRGEATYYIGVPGNYYEREKQVALMFGFESFECGTEPAQAGDFGYYMMRTQL